MWRDGAVMPAIVGSWPTADERLFPGRIYPIESSVLCGQSQPFDLCFEPLTEQPWVKWDRPFTGIRDRPLCNDHASFGVEDSNGVIHISRRVADDWLGDDVQLPIIALAWEGSYLGYGYEPCECEPMDKPRRPDYFQLSIRINAPPDDEIPRDHPGEPIWRYEASDYDETNHEHHFGSTAYGLSVTDQSPVVGLLYNTENEPMDMSLTFYTTPEP